MAVGSVSFLVSLALAVGKVSAFLKGASMRQNHRYLRINYSNVRVLTMFSTGRGVTAAQCFAFVARAG